jgi:hypothetical protein
MSDMQVDNRGVSKDVLFVCIFPRLAAGGLRPTLWTRREIRKWARGLVELMTVCKALKPVVQPWLVKIKRMLELLHQRPALQTHFEEAAEGRWWPNHAQESSVTLWNPWLKVYQEMWPSPILVDIFMSVCEASVLRPYTKGKHFDDAPLLEIMDLMPESIQCEYGEMRCRHRVTPLAAAAYGYRDIVGLEWIEELLKRGAHPKSCLQVLGERNYDLVNDLLSNCKDNEWSDNATKAHNADKRKRAMDVSALLIRYSDPLLYK